MTLPEVKQVHFIGIGGYGMSALAQVLLQMGYRVTGSDINDSALVRQLAARGAEIKLFHHPDQIGSSELVIHSTAIPPDNCELQEARRRGIPVWHRSELLAALIN
ncbi:MAG: Mur ligase domain-containing protein, partial [Dethiobacteria bacterium]